MHNSIVAVSQTFISKICSLYGDLYDDRIEDSSPPTAGQRNGTVILRAAGFDWSPGMPSAHKSLSAFQEELRNEHGIRLSTSKIRKILISGGLWTTERSREIQRLYYMLTQGSQEKPAVAPEQAVAIISQQLGISRPMVTINLPYSKGINGLYPKSRNAIRCERYRLKKAEKEKNR